jgi:Holliday junction resolvase RusA-like endonuclease
MKIVINTPLPTLNEYISAERTNKYIASAMKKKATNRVAIIAMSQTREQIAYKVDIVFTWFAPNNKLDHDNIAFAKKFVLDGLVQAKILPIDSVKFVGNFKDIFGLDKNRSYVCCDIELLPFGTIL